MEVLSWCLPAKTEENHGKPVRIFCARPRFSPITSQTQVYRVTATATCPTGFLLCSYESRDAARTHSMSRILRCCTSLEVDCLFYIDKLPELLYFHIYMPFFTPGLWFAHDKWEKWQKVTGQWSMLHWEREADVTKVLLQPIHTLQFSSQSADSTKLLRVLFTVVRSNTTDYTFVIAQPAGDNRPVTVLHAVWQQHLLLRNSH